MRFLKLKNHLILISILALLFACNSETNDKTEKELDRYSYAVGATTGFAELVDGGVKQLGLGVPMPPEEMDEFMDKANEIAEKFNISIYREADLIETDLFREGIAEGLDVPLLYRGTTLDQYFKLKADKEKLVKEGKYDAKARREIARRFGRLLSYSPRYINRLLSEKYSFRTMSNFGIRANNLFLYYKDLEKAGAFYSETLGFEIVADYKMAKILRMTFDSYLILVDATKGMHTANEPKTVALALLTDKLEEWHTYLKSKKVEIKYDYKPKAESAHDGFVIVDPEGYLLEIENFNQHPENEKFIPMLSANEKRMIISEHKNSVPKGLGFHSTIVWLYNKDVLAMQHFYQDVLGLDLVVDQGWAKIYQVSKTGFMAIVDEKRGMHKFTEKKAVNVGFILDDVASWFNYVKENKVMPLREEELGIEAETRYKAFVAYGPEAYYFEFDQFFPHDDNTKFWEYLKEDY